VKQKKEEKEKGSTDTAEDETKNSDYTSGSLVKVNKRERSFSVSSSMGDQFGTTVVNAEQMEKDIKIDYS